MLTRIDRIRNLGVFAEFNWSTALPPFKRYNLIFGWNGSGKTTLSRLLSSLEAGSNPAFPNLEYQITVGDAKLSNKDPFTPKVRAFNSDYVERNVRVLEAHANPIYILGEKSQTTLNEIAKDEASLYGVSGDPTKPGKIELRRRSKVEADQLTKQIDNAFTQIARTISAAWTAGGITRTYRRPNAQAAYDKLAHSHLLSSTEIAERSMTLTQAHEPTVDLLMPSSTTTSGAALQSELSNMLAQAKSALASTVQNVAIARLVKHKDLSSWVEEGLNIHKHHSSSECEFCGQSIPQERLAALADHFSDEDRQLKDRLDNLNNTIANIHDSLGQLQPHHEAKLFKQFRESYATAVKQLGEAKNQLAASLTQLARLLNTKRSQTTEPLACTVDLDATSFLAALTATNKVLGAHNT